MMRQNKAFYENGYIWFPFYELKEADFESVYNIEVEDDHSYIAQGCISKNCTDLSVAGKMQGMSKADWENGKSTRSGLLWEVERILKELPEDELPQVLLMENVPQVHAEKNKEDFENWCKFLRSKGYFNQYIDLNAKNYGIPQNRERCFMISMLSDEYVEIDFPEEIPLETVMKDYLENEIDEKYYINSKKAQKLIAELIERGELPQTDRQTRQDKTRQDKDCSHIQNCQVVVLGQMDNTIDHTFESANRVYSRFGACPTIPTCTGGGIQPKIEVEIMSEKKKVYKIRKLTPRECFRLMNYTDSDFDRAASVNSNSQLYKQAGNAIVKSCLMAIFLQLNIKGLKPWNDMTSEEKYNLIQKSKNS